MKMAEKMCINMENFSSSKINSVQIKSTQGKIRCNISHHPKSLERVMDDDSDCRRIFAIRVTKMLNRDHKVCVKEKQIGFKKNNI